MATINVAALTEAAKKYDPIIRELPYYALQEMASKLKLNIIKGGENIMVFKRRKAGGHISRQRCVSRRGLCDAVIFHHKQYWGSP